MSGQPENPPRYLHATRETSLMNFATLQQAVGARRASDRVINFIEAGSSERPLRFSDLHERAAGMLFHLQKRGATSGSETILLVDRNEQFIDVFWACILGGIIVVPLAPGA